MEKAAQGKTGDAARAGAAEPEVYQMSDYEAAKKLGVSAAEPEVYQMSGYEAAKKLGVSIEAGLDEAAVRLSKSAHGKNALSRQKKAGLFKRIVDAVTEPMMLILLFAFAVTFSVNCVKAYHNEGFDYPECVGIFAAIVISVCITLFMEGRSAKAFEALRSFSANILVKVLRGGAWLPLPAADLAVGDVVEFAVGDKIPADCRVLKTDEFEVDESPLTGESYPVQKDAARVFSRGAFPPLAERVNMAYAGCFVTAGSALALVTAVGDKTEIGGIAQSLKDAGDALTPLQQKLSRLGKTIAIIGAAAAALVFTLQLVQLIVTKSVTFDSVQNIFITAIVLIVAAVPEGLPTIVAISFALNVIKMAREHALVKKMAACETVGGVSVICSDKTGTLTENKMTVEVIRGQGSGVRGQGPMDSVGAVDIPPESEELGIRSDQRWIGLQRSNPSVIPHSSLLTPNLTRNICINSTADVSPDFKTGEYAFIGSPTECALLVAYEKSGPKKSYAQVRKEARIVRVFPFSGELKRMTTVVDSGQRAADGGQFAVLCKGAPETVLELCEISAHEKGRILNEISAYQRQAKRVIAFAHSAIVGADALAGPPRMHSVRPIEPAKASSPTGESVYSGKFRGVAALPGDGCGDTKREARSARQGFESLPFETSVPVPPTFPPGKVSLQQYFPPREVPNPEISGQWSVASGRLKEDKSHFRIPNPESRIPNPESRIPNPASFRREDVEHNLIFDGYAVISDPIRKDVYAAVAACKGAGIEVKMLTGDNAATAAAVARELGILPGALSTVHCVDARDIDQMSDAELAERLSSIKVVARNTPATKLRIVNALKSRGEVVAVTGDGVNDAPAVKAA
ncbi:MAG: HAD-IC family P-type ATPase, partial [Firmicutes bacterium]|nr:HAD-IC family P-type ATPase [Bacillota bacterium]